MDRRKIINLEHSDIKDFYGTLNSVTEIMLKNLNTILNGISNMEKVKVDLALEKWKLKKEEELKDNWMAAITFLFCQCQEKQSYKF